MAERGRNGRYDPVLSGLRVEGNTEKIDLRIQRTLLVLSQSQDGDDPKVIDELERESGPELMEVARVANVVGVLQVVNHVQLDISWSS
jgi:hypothetical protein